MPCDPKRLDANIAQSNNPQTAALASSPPYDYDPATESPSALARIQAPEPRAGAPTLGVKIDDVSMDAPDAAAKLLLETNPHSVVITLANLDDITDKFLYITIPQGLTVSEYPGMGGAPLPDYMQGYVTLFQAPPVVTNAADQKSYYGTMAYKLADDLRSIVIEIFVSVDRNLFYGGSEALSNLAVELVGSSVELPVDKEVGITAATDLLVSFSAGFRIQPFNLGTATSTDVGAVRTYGQILYSYLKDYGIEYIPKNMVVIIDYSAGASLQSVAYDDAPTGALPDPLPGNAVEYTGPGGNGSIAWDELNHKVYFYYSENQRARVPKVTVKWDKATPGSTYYVTQATTATAWDGSTISIPTVNAGIAAILNVDEDKRNRLTIIQARSQPVYVSPSGTDAFDGLTLVASFVFQNPLQNAVTDQVIRYDFPLGLHVRGFDIPARNAAQSAAISVRYETYGGVIRENITAGSFVATNNRGKRLTPSALGLLPDESIKWAEATAGTYTGEWTYVPYQEQGSMVYGRPDDSEPSYTTSVTITSTTPGDMAPPVTATATATVESIKKESFYVRINPGLSSQGNYIYSSKEEIKFSGTIETAAPNFEYISGTRNIQSVQNPNIYIVLPKNMDVKAGSLTVTQSGSSVIASVTTATVNDGSGRKVVIVKTNGTIGYMNPNMTAYPVFSFNFALISDPAITLTQFNDTSLFFVGLNDSDPSQLTTVYRGNAINEPIDFNNNTVIDKVVTEADVYLNTITVMATPDMRITAGIGLDENSASTYNPDTGAEIVPLANGIDAKYVLDILSTMPDEAGTFRAYIPVPHTGKNYGTEFQLGAFTWNMALKGAPTMSSPNYTAEYTSANIESRSDAEVAPYKTVDQMSAGDWANVTMIRVTNINPIQPNANDRIVFTYTVDDASDPTVVQKLNIFRPVFFVESSVVSGWLEGSYAAAALTSGEISGFVWEDTSRNGILDGTEAKFPGVVVRLRLPSAGTGSNYGSISGLPTGSDADGNYAEVTTDASGNYTFPLIPAGISYDVQFVNPDDALWWFTTQHAGNDATIDSDADPATGIANNINPTNLATARYISAGLRRIRYTVTFDKNDGDTDAIPTTKPVTRPSDKVDSLPSPPTKACHTFVGWFSTPAPTGGSQFTENTPVNEDLLVYARFAEKQFTVTFDGNGADTPANPDSKTVMCTVGHVDALPAQPAKDCHTFVGWFDTSAPTGGIQFTDASAVSGDKTVYARFTEDQFTIAFDGNGGDTPPSFTSKTVNCTDPYVDPLPLPPSKACHDFIGWFTTSAQTGGSAFTAATPVTASLTRVYARYSLIQYTVTFNSNGADTPANPGSKTVTCPATTVGTLPAPPVKTDYTFLGWFDTCDQTGGTQFTAASQVTAEMTVCARYRLTTFIVDFDKNGGDTEASPNQKPVTYPADTVGMMPSPPSKACHTFIGWFSTSNPTGGSQFTAITPVSAHTRVYARYSIIQYTVTFDKNGGDTEAVPPAKVVTCPDVTVDALPVPPGKACHTFVGWFSTSNPTGGSQFTAASAVYADKTVYARYALKQYTVSFNSNGGYTEADPRQKTIICPAATVDALPTPPVRPCHTFAGWFDTPDKTGGTQFTEASAVAEDKIVYARFQEIQYTVSFHSNGGDTQPDPPSKTVMCTYGRLGTLPMPPSRDCYQFAGWFNTNAETGGSQYGAASIVNADRDLYARWRRITHTITYSKGQATAGSPPESETVNCGDNYSPAAGAGTLERFGYTFDGWSATNGGEAASNIADVRANQTLYPVWKAVDNTLSFALESGNAVIEHVHVGDFVNLDDRIEQPSKEGYTLLGYSTDPDAKKPLVRSQFVLTPSLLQQMLASTQPGARDFIIILYPIFLLNTHTEMRSHMNTAVGNWANTLANEAEVCYWDIIEMFDMKIDLRVVPDIDPGDLP